MPNERERENRLTERGSNRAFPFPIGRKWPLFSGGKSSISFGAYRSWKRLAREHSPKAQPLSNDSNAQQQRNRLCGRRRMQQFAMERERGGAVLFAPTLPQVALWALYSVLANPTSGLPLKTHTHTHLKGWLKGWSASNRVSFRC